MSLRWIRQISAWVEFHTGKQVCFCALHRSGQLWWNEDCRSYHRKVERYRASTD